MEKQKGFFVESIQSQFQNALKKGLRKMALIMNRCKGRRSMANTEHEMTRRGFFLN
jgi:hypothetical protein